MWEVILETMLDTLKAVPILFVAYLLVAYFSGKKKHKLNKALNRYGPLVAGGLGCVPQCGFAAVMADLYSKRIITIGTLFAVFIATSDEAFIILIAYPAFYKELFLLLAIKLAVAILFGYLIDFLFRKKNNVKNLLSNENLTSCVCNSTSGHVHCGCENNVKALSSGEIKKDKNENQEYYKCHHGSGSGTAAIFSEALMHTLKIAALLFVVGLLLNLIVEWFGADRISLLFQGNELLSILFATLIGLIPTCAISVILVTFFMSGFISFAALVAGLCAGTGLGLIVLFSKNKNIKENIYILLILFVISLFVGYLVYLFGLI
ncbi:MAG: putative manganese transporter [Clostridia bacterium]|nr:putative manganese transporter [Clostridia bacterium]